MSGTRLSPPAVYPASASGEPAYAADGWRHGTDSQAAAQPGRDAGQVLRVLALIAVAVGLAALTAAACVLSYSSVHHLAIQAGVHGRLASIYPIIFDALLVVAGCSVLALRGAGLVSRVYSWLCVLVLLAALAAGGALHAAAVKVPHKLAAVVAAIVPWALVLIGFGLLVAMLRYGRLRRLAKRHQKRRVAVQASPPEEAPAMVGAPVIPVTERDREEYSPQRPLIPGLPPRPQAITAAEPALTEHADQDTAAPETADTASGGTGVEPPTAPSRSAVAAPAPATSAATTAAQDQPAVRRVEMQLRARTPRLPAQDTAGAGSAAPAWQTPFAPKVERGAPAEQDDQQPVVSGFESTSADPATGQDPATEPAATESSPEDADSAGPLNAAPTVSADDEDPGGLPAFRRTRSSPTPPQDD
jgi:hypothetical protein